jgi:biotin transport system permease protein
VTLALYHPAPSAVHRAPAGLKLLVLAALGVLLFAVPRLDVVGGALAGVLVVGLGLAHLPGRVLWAQVRPVLIWLAALFVVHLLVTDALTGALAVSRLLTLVLAAAVVTATSRVTALVAVVERICSPLRWVGVRPARIGLVIAMTLRFIPLIAERAARIREAQAARGGARRLTILVVPLLVQVLQMAHTTAEALDARGADEEPLPRRRTRRSR